MDKSSDRSITKSPDAVPVAVIGVGEHGKKHAKEFQLVAGAELVGVYDLRPERTLEVASELGVRAFATLDEALGAARAVSIVIPTSGHAEVARAAFERGVDVLLEKPITRTVEEADEVIALAAARGRILQVGHVERFNPGVVAAQAITRRPLFFEIHRLGVFSPRSLDVDVVFDLMIHDLDLVLWLAGSEVSDVRAVGLPVLSDKVDIANARVEFDNGTVANLTASRVSTERVRKFRFFQPSEYVSIDFTRRDVLVLSVDRDGGAPKIGFRKLETKPEEPLRAELAAFTDSVRTRRAPLVGGAEGRRALALAERVMICIEQHAAQVGVPLVRPAGQSGEI
ncbi:MAG: Gfo/Idh/MocA family oxidoreductase [Acidobacteria bacterium]|nr:Gfo/Idh/MocA family oxidoreductase [Acidobacteriota bacterium]